MKKSTEVVTKKENIVWSWLLRAYSALFSASISPPLPVIFAISLKRFLKLPDSLVREIISYFPLSERGDLLAFKPDNRLFLFQKDLLDVLNVEQSTETFIHLMTLVTLDGPDNQNQARAMLAQYPLLTPKLMSMQRKMDESAAARQFKQPISAYEYAWCITDTSMCQMLEQHMSEGIKAKIRQQCEARAVEKFMYLITREGDDNQNKAEAMLKQYPHLVAQLISSEIDTRDLTRHFIKPMSAYAYAYWSGDTRMRTMLNNYVFKDEALQSKVDEQCNSIAKLGIEFERLSNDGKPIPNSTVSHSKHFDYQPLKDAYDAYNAEATRLINNQNSEEDWAHAEVLWLKKGQEWAKAPVSGMQEICSPHPFHPLQTYQATLTSPSIVRTLEFYNWESGKDEYLASRGLVNSKLGDSISIYKAAPRGSLGGTTCAGMRLRGPGGPVDSDSAAVIAMCKARTDDDLKRTLVSLKLAEPRSRLNL